MDYNAVGIMSGSSMDGLDIAFVRFSEHKGKWAFNIVHAETKAISNSWIKKLSNATALNAKDYLMLHTAFGQYCGERVQAFLQENKVGKIDCIGFHGHTTFHLPAKQTTHQLGDGAAVSAITGIPVIADLRALDVALGGQGAPIIPIGEKLLFTGYDYYLNIGGIANVSMHHGKKIIAFDVCPANRVLNMLAALAGKKFDKDGTMASEGIVNKALLTKLNALGYYRKAYPKSLANDFGTDTIYPLIINKEKNVRDALATCVEHIAKQVTAAIEMYREKTTGKLMVTGGGALNQFLVARLKYHLMQMGIEVAVPEKSIIEFKEALVMALIAVLRLRNEPNVLATVTGAARDSCNGALWSGK